MSTQRRVVLGVIAFVVLVVVLNLVARGLDESVGGNAPGGADGSSYATTAGGTGAYAQLLGDYGHPVSRARGPLAQQSFRFRLYWPFSRLRTR